MRISKPLSAIHAGVAALSASLFAACGSPTSPTDATPPPPPAPSAESRDAAVPPPDDNPAPQISPAGPVQPTPEAPPTPDASPAAKPSSAPTHLVQEPSLAAMKPAVRSAKMTVPVDLSYSFSADPVTGQPTTLHLAAVPRVGGTNLNVSVKQEPGVRVEMAPGSANIQKASAAGVYRKQMAVTRVDPSANRVRILVTMDLAYGSGFGFFTIPLDGAGTRDLVKQH